MNIRPVLWGLSFTLDHLNIFNCLCTMIQISHKFAVHTEMPIEIQLNLFYHLFVLHCHHYISLYFIWNDSCIFLINYSDQRHWQSLTLIHTLYKRSEHRQHDMTVLKPSVWRVGCHHLVFYGTRSGWRVEQGRDKQYTLLRLTGCGNNLSITM